MTDPTVRAYLEAVRLQDDDIEHEYLAPQPKRYPLAPQWKLPWPGPGALPLSGEPLARLSALLMGFAPHRVDMLTVAGLAALQGTVARTPHPALRLTFGWLGLRLALPSGGAFHPAEIYLAWAGSADLPSGVYHYQPYSHSLEQLRPGSFREHMLLFTHRPWKNISKYRAFGYRLGLLDCGVLIGQISTCALAGDLTITPEPRLTTELLGLDPMLETVYATAAIASPAQAQKAQTLPAEDSARRGDTGREAAPPSDPPALPEPAGMAHDVIGLRYADPRTIALHRALVATGPQRPACQPGAAWRGVAASATGVALPAVPELDLAAATPRRSSAINLRAGITVRQLAAILAHTAKGLDSITAHSPRPQLWCFAHQVNGLDAGAYRFDPDSGHLLPSTGAGEESLPHHIEPRMATAGALLYLVCPAEHPMDSLAPEQFRGLHLLAGAALQLAGLAATAVGAGSRVLGSMTAEAVAAWLGLPPGARPIIQMLLGLPATRPGGLSAQLTKGRWHG